MARMGPTAPMANLGSRGNRVNRDSLGSHRSVPTVAAVATAGMGAEAAMVGEAETVALGEMPRANHADACRDPFRGLAL